MTEQRTHYNVVGTIALMVVGLLILVPSGLCTGAMGIAAIATMAQSGSPDAAGLLGMALTIGGPFVIVGGIMVWFAVKRMRGR